MSSFLDSLGISPSLLVLIIVLVIYGAIAYLIWKDPRFKERGVTLWGPIIMWRTKRGLGVIDQLARPKRFWAVYGGVAKAICAIAMVSMFLLLLWEATIVPSIPAENAPSPELMLGIPGINPIIPIWYGILGLVVAIVVHEFAHGILTRASGMRLKALGLLFIVIPLGAFAEPDEDELVKTTKKRRGSVYAVGPATNIILAIVCGLIFSTAMVAGVQPINDSPVVVSMLEEGPAEMADLEFADQIITVNGSDVIGLDGFYSVDAPDPGDTTTLSYMRNGESYDTTAYSGVVMTSVSEGYPADDAGVEVGMIVYSLNGTVITNSDALTSTLKMTVPGQTVELTMLTWDGEGYSVDHDVTEITLTSRLDYLRQVDPSSVDDESEDYGMMGINSAYLGTGITTPEALKTTLAHPFDGADGFSGNAMAALRYISLPFSGLMPVPSEVGALFEPTGIWSGLSTNTFWIIANSMYWIFWINLMVGLTNALPAVPLDGGYLFHDWMDSIVKRVKRGSSVEWRERVVGQITTLMAFTILFLILWQLIGPRLN